MTPLVGPGHFFEYLTSSSFDTNGMGAGTLAENQMALSQIAMLNCCQLFGMATNGFIFGPAWLNTLNNPNWIAINQDVTAQLSPVFDNGTNQLSVWKKPLTNGLALLLVNETASSTTMTVPLNTCLLPDGNYSVLDCWANTTNYISNGLLSNTIAAGDFRLYRLNYAGPLTNLSVGSVTYGAITNALSTNTLYVGTIAAGHLTVDGSDITNLSGGGVATNT